MSRFFIRVQPLPEQAGAYITRGGDGLPRLTREQPEPLSIEEAEALLRDAVCSCGAGLLLELADAAGAAVPDGITPG